MADDKLTPDLNFDDFELPPLPARPVKLGASAAVITEEKTDDFELPPMPVKQSEEAPAQDIIDNFDLTPTPADQSEEAPAQDITNDFELPPMPAKQSEEAPAQDIINDFDLTPTLADQSEEAPAEDNSDDFDLPPMPVKQSEEAPAEDNSDDFELPPLPEKKPEEDEMKEEPSYEEEASYETETSQEDQVFDFDSEYDLDDLDKIDSNSIVLEEMSHRVAPIRTGEEDSARNMKEKIRMNDLASEFGNNVPVLDDLSDEYAAPEKAVDSLVDKEKLDDDEKRILKQNLAADLGKRPENFNARASQNMYNKLMEQKKLKIAKKGFALSLIPVILGLISAVITFTQLGWGSYQFISYFAVFMVLAALMLLIKSKHTKLFAITIYAICLLINVIPGLILYVMDEKMQQAPDKVMHLVFAIAACACNIISIIILNKNEAVNTYYNSNFKRK